MDIRDAIAQVVDGQHLAEQAMQAVMHTIMSGEATPAQIGALLVGLRMKGESVAEITGAARAMRALSAQVMADPLHLVDTCGTGGDGSNLFNVSTASAFVAAAAGARVAKHGNRSVTSKSGSADVLEAAGVNLDLTPEQVSRCIDSLGIGFLFAVKHHGAMKHAIGPRRELGIRTIFNMLGPLTNPASAPNQVLGVFAQERLHDFAEVLQALGSRHVLVVRSDDALDEISIAAPTAVAELKDGQIREYRVTPEDFGLRSQSLDSLKVSDAAGSLALIEQAFAGETGPAADIIALNAGAAIHVAGLTPNWQQGVRLAQDVIATGQAREKLRDLVQMTRLMMQLD